MAQNNTTDLKYQLERYILNNTPKQLLAQQSASNNYNIEAQLKEILNICISTNDKVMQLQETIRSEVQRKQWQETTEALYGARFYGKNKK